MCVCITLLEILTEYALVHKPVKKYLRISFSSSVLLLSSKALAIDFFAVAEVLHFVELDV